MYFYSEFDTREGRSDSSCLHSDSISLVNFFLAILDKQ